MILKCSSTFQEDELRELIAEINQTIDLNQKQLQDMNAFPEKFNDPLTMFQIKVQHYKWFMNGAKIQYHKA
ncbi:hypothetical protein [Bacillus sp. T3]|uniref:hypothetical protein n=1 Tax=Bacillus sp. T3 TaxID=467262 RepID=UPI002981EB9A|nr:hypothetical protein [Bacillus sp. T3]